MGIVDDKMKLWEDSKEEICFTYFDLQQNGYRTAKNIDYIQTASLRKRGNKLMKMYCKNCGKKFYPTDDGWVGYPQWTSDGQKRPANKRVFHSRFCWEDWTNKNIDAYTNFCNNSQIVI